MARKTLENEALEFGRAVSQLTRRLRAESDSQDFSWTQLAVIARLDKDGPATTAELARAESIKPQSMGVAVAALEEMGIVERKRHASDGRQQNVELTAKGAALRRHTREARRGWLGEALGRLSDDERQTLFAAGEIMKRLAER